MLIVMPTTRIGYDKSLKIVTDLVIEKSWYFDLMFHLFIGKINNKKYEHSTTLSSYVWKLKNENVPYRVSWDIAGRAAPFNPATNICWRNIWSCSDRWCYPEPKLGVLYDMQTQTARTPRKSEIQKVKTSLTVNFSFTYLCFLYLCVIMFETILSMKEFIPEILEK